MHCTAFFHVLLGLVVTISAQGSLGGSQSSCSDSEAWAYHGCYGDADNGLHAGFTWRLSPNPNSVFYYPPYAGLITPSFCQAACRGHGFRYAALYNGGSCYCATKIPNRSAQESTTQGAGPAIGSNPGAVTSITTCHVYGKTCSGDSSQFCGSSTASDVYEDPSFSNMTGASAASNFLYLGCFSNTAPGPLYVELQTNSTASCAAYCGALGYAFSGRSGYDSQTDSQTCGCGSEIQTGNQVDESYCNFFCNGGTAASGGASSCGGQDVSSGALYWTIFQNTQLQGCYRPSLPGSQAGIYHSPVPAAGTPAVFPSGYTATLEFTQTYATSVFITQTVIRTASVFFTTVVSEISTQYTTVTQGRTITETAYRNQTVVVPTTVNVIFTTVVPTTIVQLTTLAVEASAGVSAGVSASVSASVSAGASRASITLGVSGLISSAVPLSSLAENSLSMTAVNLGSSAIPSLSLSSLSGLLQTARPTLGVSGLNSLAIPSLSLGSLSGLSIPTGSSLGVSSSLATPSSSSSISSFSGLSMSTGSNLGVPTSLALPSISLGSLSGLSIPTGSTLGVSGLNSLAIPSISLGSLSGLSIPTGSSLGVSSSSATPSSSSSISSLTTGSNLGVSTSLALPSISLSFSSPNGLSLTAQLSLGVSSLSSLAIPSTSLSLRPLSILSMTVSTPGPSSGSVSLSTPSSSVVISSSISLSNMLVPSSSMMALTTSTLRPSTISTMTTFVLSTTARSSSAVTIGIGASLSVGIASRSTSSSGTSPSSTPTAPFVGVATTVQVAGAYSFANCSQDGAGGLSIFVRAPAKYNINSVEDCANFCYTYNAGASDASGVPYDKGPYNAFGVEYYAQCYCTNQLNYTQGPSNGCTFACTNAANEICGGANAANVYVLSSLFASPVVPLPIAFSTTSTRISSTSMSSTVSSAVSTSVAASSSSTLTPGSSSSSIASALPSSSSSAVSDSTTTRESQSGTSSGVSTTAISAISSVNPTTSTSPLSFSSSSLAASGSITSSESQSATAISTVAVVSTTSSASPSTLTSAVPLSVYAYQNCSTDASSSNMRAIYGPANLNVASVEQCASFCYNYPGGVFAGDTFGPGPYPVIGVEYFSQCFCGSSFAYGTYGLSTQCNTPCSGAMNETCGGPNALNVYVLDASGSPGISPYSFGSLSPASPGSSSDTTTGTPTVISISSASSASTSHTITLATSAAASSSSTTSASSAALSATIVQNAGVYATVGCYADDNVYRAVGGIYGYQLNVGSIEACAAACASYQFPYMGMEYYSQCFCADTLNSTLGTRPVTDCETAVCSGDPTEYCGGTNSAVIVYNTPQSTFNNGYTGGPGTGTPNTVTSGYYTYSWLGCFNETGPTYHIVSDYQNSTNTGATVDACAIQCASYNNGAAYTYMGLEYYGECYCGQSLDQRANLVAPANCNLPCDGDHTESCGGNPFMGVYQLR